jgi:uncharacterized membrane protein
MGVIVYSGAPARPLECLVPQVRPSSSRIGAVDVVRGAVMALMALDHVRDYVTNVRIQPENLARGSAALFATRWVTHFCAPAFALLAGVGIGLAMQRGRSPGAMTRFLIIRGLWLIALDTVITPIGWRFGFDLLPIFALVLWALGWSMIVMAALIHLPKPAVATGAVVMIATHNLLDGIQPAALNAFAPFWHGLHVPGFAVPGVLFIAYPLIPWIAVVALGWALADVYRWEDTSRRRFLLMAGAGATALFVVIRIFNGYGDPAPWTPQRTDALTIASFLNARKYPPSLDFLLMTLGPVLITLALAEQTRSRIAAWLAVFGRVPLFYYVVHIFVAHLLAMALAYVQGGVVRRINVITDAASLPPWYGLSLPGVYAAWIAVVLVMYLLCRWFAGIKDRRRDWWLSYL